MSFDEAVREFERGVETGNPDLVFRNASAALRLLRARATELGATPADIASRIMAADGGVAGLFQVQDALRDYVERRDTPVELRLNGVWQSHEDDSLVAVFDDIESALAYFRSALLPKELRYRDLQGRVRSFRSDSLCYDSNPHGGNECEEGKGIMCNMVPWRNYDGRATHWFGERAPVRNPAPLTGPPPPMPDGAVLVEAVTA